MGRTSFNRAELDAIKSLLHKIRGAEPGRQKGLRERLRRQFDFYISDFATDRQGFVASDIDALVRRGVIVLVDDTTSPPLTAQRSAVPATGAPSSPAPSVEPSTAAPALFAALRRADLEAAGFTGWRTWAELRSTQFAEIPATPGVYTVHRPKLGEPTFLEESPAGRFKDRDPTVSPATLRENWVSGAGVVYIGKADALRTRLRQYARFGAGERVGHWGGRYIWQLADAGELLVAWHEVAWGESAREYERRLLARFADLHAGRRPFANLAG